MNEKNVFKNPQSVAKILWTFLVSGFLSSNGRSRNNLDLGYKRLWRRSNSYQFLLNSRPWWSLSWFLCAFLELWVLWRKFVWIFNEVAEILLRPLLKSSTVVGLHLQSDQSTAALASQDSSRMNTSTHVQQAARKTSAAKEIVLQHIWESLRMEYLITKQQLHQLPKHSLVTQSGPKWVEKDCKKMFSSLYSFIFIFIRLRLKLSITASQEVSSS